MSEVKKLSIFTGVTYLLMVPFGILGILYIPNNIFVAGDTLVTIENIASHKVMFHLSILASLIVQLIQIILVFLLYKLFSHVNKTSSILMVAFIIPALSIAMLNEVNLLVISSLVNGTYYSTNFTTSQIQGLIGLLFEFHQAGIMIAQIFWGAWLFPMGYLVYHSGYVPRLIGILLMVGCFGYLTDSVLFIMNIDIGFTVSEFTFFGEVLLPLWLVFKANNIAQLHPLSKVHIS